MEQLEGTEKRLPSPVKPLDTLFDHEPDDDPFAQISGAEETPQDIPQQPKDDNGPSARNEIMEGPVDDPSTGDRDFGDLLAEFEAEQTGEMDDSGHAEFTDHKDEESLSHTAPVVAAAPDRPAPVNAPSGLFDQSPQDDHFDILVAPAAEEADVSRLLSPMDDGTDLDPTSAGPRDPPHSNGVGDQSMQSSLADESEWLADTSLEESFAGRNDRAPSTPPTSSAKALPRQPERQETENGDELVSFEVPQGWFDDAGNWNWYTDEQREQVRLTMMGQGGWDQEGNDADVSYTAEPSPGLPYTPGLQAVSENAARRTPMRETNPYERSLVTDPYAASQPPTASTTGSYDSYQSGSRSSLSGQPSPYAPTFNQASQYGPRAGQALGYGAATSQPTGYGPTTDQSNAYAPPKQSPQYAPVQASNPYAPPTQPYAPAPAQSYPAPQPYGVQQPYSSIPPFVPPAGPSNISKPPPKAPQRMPSTAYDPPMLKPQKKVTRSTSTMSFTPSGFNTPPTPSQATFGSPPSPAAAPAAPPTGPPRRAKTPKAEPPPPSTLPPIPDGQMPRASSPPAQMAPRSDSYATGQSSMGPPPGLPQSDPDAAGQGSMPPPPGPPQRPASSQQSRLARTPSYATFDPPLRPASTSRQREVTRPPIPAFTAPPVASPPRMLSPPQVMPPPRSTSPQTLGIPPPPVQALSPPAPAYEPPRTSSRASQRKSPMFQAKPTFEARPSSGASAQNAPRFDPSPATARQDSRAEEQADRRMESAGLSKVQGQMSPPPVPAQQNEPSDLYTMEYDRDPRDTAAHAPRDASRDAHQTPAYGLGLNTHHGAGSLNGNMVDNEQRKEPSEDIYSPTNSIHAPQSGSDAGGYRQHDMPNGNHGGSEYGPTDYYTSHDRAGSTSSRSQSPLSRPQPAQSYDAGSSVDGTTLASYDPYAPTSHVPQVGVPHNAVNTDPYAPSSQNVPRQQPYGANDQSYAPSSQNAPPQQPYGANDQLYAPSYAPSHSTQHSEGGYAPSHQHRESQAYAPASYQSHGGADPYAPASYQPRSNDQSYASTSGFGTGSSPPPQHQSLPSISSVQDHTYTPQQVLEQRPVSEDPLGRATLAARNAPIAVFGFGGLLITAFPGLAEDHAVEENDDGRTPAYGYASGRGRLWIRSVDEISSSSAFRTSDTPFPGPLVLDPSAVKGAAGDKKKREAVLGYLEARAKEIEQGLPYLKTSASQSRREEEGKLALVRLLTAMIIGNGKLSGSSEVEEAVRNALAGSSEPSSVISTAANPLSPIRGAGASGYFPGQSSQSAKATPGQLAQLSTYLKRGEKAEAVQFAMSSGLWSHALLISSSVDAERWKEVVMAFLHAELGSSLIGNSAMRTSYTLFAGLTPASVDDVINIANITSDASADQWQQVLSAIVFNGKPADLVCIDDLAAKLNASGLINAAHACHLLSPTSPFSDTTPAVFDRLIGLTQNPKDDDALVFAEVAEYARSLIPVSKGQDATVPGLPQLLPYKLQRAWRLAELGDVEQAQRYCTAIGSASRTTKNGPSLLPFALLASLEDLLERLTGKPSASPANLLMPNRNKKTGVDKFGSWIEGRLTKFIAGEEETAPSSHIKVPPAKAKLDPKDAHGSIGPFSHFSTISPAASGTVSRSVSTLDFPAMNGQLQDSAAASPAMLQGAWGQPLDDSNPPSTYGAYEPSGRSTSNPWSGSAPGDSPDRSRGEDDGDVVNPMAYMNLGPSPEAARVNYTPQPVNLNEGGDDDDDLGFGNSSLSRSRTPKPAEGSQGSKQASPGKAGSSVEDTPKQLDKPALAMVGQKGSWMGRWWAKKEGEGSGPVRAKLGEESSMVFDPTLKRWVVKGQKPDAAPTPPAPPPRAQTVSPAIAGEHAPGFPRSSSVAPPANLGMSAPPIGVSQQSKTLPRSTTAPIGFTQLADGSVRRAKPPLESLAGDGPPPMPLASSSSSMSSKSSSPSIGPPPPGLRRSTTGASLDDLLSRPPSKRPSSAARKPMKNRYVDVFQPGQQ